MLTHVTTRAVAARIVQSEQALRRLGLFDGAPQAVAARINAADDATSSSQCAALLAYVKVLTEGADSSRESRVLHIAAICSDLNLPRFQKAQVSIVLAAALYYERIGALGRALQLGRRAERSAWHLKDPLVHLRIHDGLAGLHARVVDTVAAISHLRRALALTTAKSGRIGTAAVLNRCVELQMVAHRYQSALDTLRLALGLIGEGADNVNLRLRLAIKGLTCAWRLDDADAAVEFLGIACADLLDPRIEAAERTQFEVLRALYLVEKGDAETASDLVEAAQRALRADPSLSTETALDLAQAICQGASGDPAVARRARVLLLGLLYQTRMGGAWHAETLYALARTGATEGASSKGIAPAHLLQAERHARELVDLGTKRTHLQMFCRLAAEDDERLGGDAMSVPPVSTRDFVVAEEFALNAEFAHDPSGLHIFRVGRYSEALARAIGMGEDFCTRIALAARLHDIGMAVMHDGVLSHAAKPDAAESYMLRQHMQRGGDVLAGTMDRTLQMAAEIALWHHEFWNGTGYPARLRETRIPLAARICALADAYDALTVAKPTLAAAEVLRRLGEQAGTRFDPDLTRAFIDLIASGANFEIDALARADVEAHRVMQEHEELEQAIVRACASHAEVRTAPL